ncbi:MAG: hypothetical protein IT462_14860 [Planctomycetes bacterium]|nr:hypothetical protein [Planctomycetota bacterium]
MVYRMNAMLAALLLLAGCAATSQRGNPEPTETERSKWEFKLAGLDIQVLVEAGAVVRIGGDWTSDSLSDEVQHLTCVVCDENGGVIGIGVNSEAAAIGLSRGTLNWRVLRGGSRRYGLNSRRNPAKVEVHLYHLVGLHDTTVEAKRIE